MTLDKLIKLSKEFKPTAEQIASLHRRLAAAEQKFIEEDRLKSNFDYNFRYTI